MDPFNRQSDGSWAANVDGHEIVLRPVDLMTADHGHGWRWETQVDEVVGCGLAETLARAKAEFRQSIAEAKRRRERRRHERARDALVASFLRSGIPDAVAAGRRRGGSPRTK